MTCKWGGEERCANMQVMVDIDYSLSLLCAACQHLPLYGSGRGYLPPEAAPQDTQTERLD